MQTQRTDFDTEAIFWHTKYLLDSFCHYITFNIKKIILFDTFYFFFTIDLTRHSLKSLGFVSIPWTAGIIITWYTCNSKTWNELTLTVLYNNLINTDKKLPFRKYHQIKSCFVPSFVLVKGFIFWYNILSLVVNAGLMRQLKRLKSMHLNCAHPHI